MGNFKRRESLDRGPKNFSGKKFGGRSFGGEKRNYDDRDSSRGPNLHHATCHTCGKDREVPFRPNGKKPVFCSICFDKQGGGVGSKFGEKSFDKPRFENNRNSDFYRETQMVDVKSIEPLKAQFAELNAKLDKILRIVSASTVPAISNESIEPITFEEPAVKLGFKMRKKASGVKKTKKK